VTQINKLKLVIGGYFGTSNIGDETILLNEIKALRKQFDLLILSLDPSKTSSDYQVSCGKLPSLSKPLELVQFVTEIKQCDAFILGGGGFLANSLQPFSIYYWLFLISIARLLKKKVILFSVGCGPFRAGLHSIIVRLGFNNINLILLRDKTSFFYLRNEIKCKTPLIVTADMAFLLENDKIGQTSTLPNLAANYRKPLVLFALCPRFNLRREDMNKYSKYSAAMGKLADFVLDEMNGTPIFIPFDKKDTSFYHDIIKETKFPERVVLLNYTIDMNALLSLFKSVDFVVSARYHGILYSLIAGKPVLPIIYHHKSYSIATDLGMPYLVIGDDIEWPAQDIDLEKAKMLMLSIFSNKEEFSRLVVLKQNRYNSEARKNIVILKKYLAGNQ
jgi:polysaccharide pyruvyl transferase CsaB